MDEQNIPIDIAIRKLLDWLISRHICNRDWHSKVVDIRSKIGEALHDMPEHESIKKLLAGRHINYFVCLKIVEILKETEADSKNFFGGYGSQRMKDWQRIVSDYEQGNVFLSEAAQLLIQNVSYEVPGLKKQLVKCDQVLAECDKKDRDNDKRVLDLQQEYRKECAQLGIVGDQLKKEIICLAKNLPDNYTDIAEDSKVLKEACDLYKEFVMESLEDDLDAKVIENLSYLVTNGNTTTYQWKYGELPISIEEPEICFDEEEDKEEDSGEIDFGDDGGIDFGDDGGEIDFGDDGGGEIDFGDGGGDGEIDWGNLDTGAETIDFGVVDDVDTSAIVLEEGGMEGGVAKDEEALSILDNRRTRALIIDDLLELECFLQQRLVETTSDSSRYSLDSSRQQHNSDTLTSMVVEVKKVCSSLTTLKMQQLQMIRGSPAYADQLADSLKQKLRLVEKVKSGKSRIEAKRSEASAEQVLTKKHLENVLDISGELQNQICEDVSKRFKGRKVHIMGGVATL